MSTANGNIPKVLIATPTYDGRVCNARAIADARAYEGAEVEYMTVRSSLLCFARNSIWCEALNLRMASKCTHLVFLDADVEPLVPNWLDFMLSEMGRTRASVLGAVVPLKDAGSETSHAIYEGGIRARRLTTADLRSRDRASGTWTEPDLLVSTGLMMVNMLHSSWQSVRFTICDFVSFNDGRFEAKVWPEDWNFCEDARRIGMSIYATWFPIVHWDGGTPYKLEV